MYFLINYVTCEFYAFPVIGDSSSEVAMAKRRTKSEPFSAGLYSVEGRLFRTRDDAVSYCKAERIPLWKVGLAPFPSGVDLDPIKLSLAESWTLCVLFDDGDPVILLEHATTAHAFTVRMSDLFSLVSSVRARVRELSRRS